MAANQKHWWRLPLGVAAFCLLAPIGLTSIAQATDDDSDVEIFVDPDLGERNGPALKMDADPEDIAEDRNRVIYHLVSNGYRVTSYDNTTDLAPSGIDVPYNDAITHDDPADLRFVLFDSTRRVARLSGQTRRNLLRQFERGDLVIGAEGFGRDLKKALGLIDPDLYAAGTTTGGDGLWVLLHRSPNGHLNELTIAVPEDDDSLATAFQLAQDWYNRNEEFVDPTATDGTSPWQAIHNFEWSGTANGSFEGSEQTAGTYSFLLSIYFLADATDQSTDYYRFDFGTVVGISNYEMTGHKFGDTSGNCGWWTEYQHADATITTPGGQWWRTGFMPPTTVGGTTTSFTIGGDIGTSGAKGSAAYSMSYGTPDVTIQVFSDTVDEWLLWEASLVGCGKYSWYPYYSGASDAAKSTYSLNPSFIAAVPDNAQLKFDTKAKGGSDQWGFTVRKDHIKCGFACFSIDYTEYTTTYINPISATCNTTSCS
jgi:hypothetical protein